MREREREREVERDKEGDREREVGRNHTTAVDGRFSICTPTSPFRQVVESAWFPLHLTVCSDTTSHQFLTYAQRYLDIATLIWAHNESPNWHYNLRQNAGTNLPIPQI